MASRHSVIGNEHPDHAAIWREHAFDIVSDRMDPYNLGRFIQAQKEDYAQALSEITRGL